MLKQSQVHKSNRKTWIVLGIMLSLTLIGVGGCGSTTTTSTPSQANQGTTQRPTQNPASKAVMEIRRLQSNQQNALTTDQKDKIKPILQELISTSNPSQDILQQKADAINALLTDQQKSFLTTRPNPQGNNQRQGGNNSTGNNPNGGNQKNGAGNNQTARTSNSQTIYQQVLDSLK